jgi:uncharacterized protein (DUF697 family)
MNKKKFPKAVLRTANEMRDAGLSAPKSTAMGNVVDMMPKPELTEGLNPALQTVADHGAKARRRRAVAIVERYANLSAVGGAIPVPLVNATAIAALLVRMVRSLSKLYGVPFERNRTRSVVIALMGGALPTGFSAIATSTLTYFVPGLNVLGLAISSVTSGAYARSIGQLYIEHFENGAAVDFEALARR